jgi:ABC-type phosphate/phosphonate transport system substrate-binding protein
MNHCDNCGCEIFDYYYLSYTHCSENDSAHYYLCPECMQNIRDILNNMKKHKNKKKDNSNINALSFEVIPEGYRIIRGYNNEE